MLGKLHRSTQSFLISCKVKNVGPHMNQEVSFSGSIEVAPEGAENRGYNGTRLTQHMTGYVDRWLQLPEIAKMFGLSEDSIKRLAKNHRLPLRRVTPFAMPGALETELVTWLKRQPRVGPPVRAKRRTQTKRRVVPNRPF